MKRINRYLRVIFFLLIGLLFVKPVSASERSDLDEEEKTASFYVYYHEYRRNNIACSPSNIDKTIKAISPEKITSDSELFSRDQTEVVVKIDVEDFDEEKFHINIYEDDYENGAKNDSTDCYYHRNGWNRETDDCFYNTLYFQKEGHYQILVSYDDTILESSESDFQKSCFIDGCYYGPHFTLDLTDPVVEDIQAKTISSCKVDGVDVYDDSPQFELIVDEENFNPSCFYWQYKQEGIEMSSWESYYEDKTRKNRVVFSAKKEGKYELSGIVKDPSGRASNVSGYNFILDLSAPEIEIRLKNSFNYQEYAYKTVRIFSKDTISFSLYARDDASGISSVRYSYWNSLGKITEITKDNSSGSKEFTLNLTVDQKDFCAYIKAIAIDGMGHESAVATSPVLLQESEATFSKYGKLKFIFPKAAYTDPIHHLKYYNDNPVIKMLCKNSYAGIRESTLEYQYQGSNHNISVDYHENEEINYKVQQVKKLIAEDFNRSCRNNSIGISGSFTDNAGYEIQKKMADYALVIDNTAPKINVEYKGADGSQKNEPDDYYNAACSATVRIKDWNFNPDSLDWHIDGDQEGYHIGKWHGTGDSYWCKVDFNREGTYRLGIFVSDFSGNETEWKDQKSFTIDHTAPSLRLWMNRSDVKNKKYYASDKKIYVMVEDDHVIASGIRLQSRDKKKMSVVLETEVPLALKKLIRNGKWQVYSCLCSKEALYQLSCTCEDLAGNKSDTIKMDSFIIDKTVPKIETGNLKNGVTYVDDARLSIEIHDQNLEKESCSAQILYADGTKVMNLEKLMCRLDDDAGGLTFSWKDFPRDKNMDNLYLMHIEAQDLAGNKLSAEHDILFYVDRFGARCALPSSTAANIHKYFLNQEEDIELEVFSLHPLYSLASIEHDKEEFLTLGQEELGQTSEKLVDLCGENIEDGLLPSCHQGWYKTTYRISKEYFNEEGSYYISFRCKEKYAMDENIVLTESENTLWTEKIQFAIDKTPPVVHMGGLEEKTYAADQKNITVTAMDNARLKKVKIYIRKNDNYGPETIQLYSEKDFDENHSIDFTLMSYQGYQTVGYEAWDYAGNKVSAKKIGDEKEVLILKDSLLRTYYLHPVEIAAAILSALLVCLILIFLTRGKIFAILKTAKRPKKSK